jgi:D-alanyl-D-alanine carboxypeptidase/D-alanyl-D-alanine-endopeptidase (penicillin-binding protein 4)
MWDDENNPHMPKYNAYNLDNNLIKVRVAPTGKNSRPEVTVIPEFPVKIVNKATVSRKNNMTVERRPWIDPETIYVSGEVSSPIVKTIPVGDPAKYFIYRLKQAIKANNIDFCGEIQEEKLPSKAVLVAEINHSVAEEVSHINKESNNLAAETMLKLAGSRFSGSAGTTKDGLKMFREFYTGLDVDPEQLFVVDASGVSHNDLVQTSWMSLALSKLYNQPEFDVYRNTLAVPGSKSTLDTRFNNISGKLWAKTGTLAGVSGITGYLKADKTYSFAVLIQNYKGSSVPAKKLEGRIINTLACF